MNADEHLTHFAEFVGGVALSGGTTPHVSMTVEGMTRIEDPLEKLWMAGCYALTYNWPAAERLFLEWPAESVTHERMLPWLEEHWAGVPLRKERKAVYVKTNFATSAVTYMGFARWLLQQEEWPTSYEGIYTAFNAQCKFMGRYIAIRWLEVMRRAYGTGWMMPDIHADGGQHPRKALALLYPADSELLLGNNSPEALKVADRAADRLLLDMAVEFDLHSDYYELQSLLCEYKQSYIGKKQYPGKSIDSEMGHFDKVYAYWGEDKAHESEFYDIRAKCFPDWSRGEIAGWNGSRKVLGTTLTDHGFTWSDAVYDYTLTEDIAHPVHRVGGKASIL